eukprot:6665978-Pyramimonas_sp.AAC.1
MPAPPSSIVFAILELDLPLLPRCAPSARRLEVCAGPRIESIFLFALARSSRGRWGHVVSTPLGCLRRGGLTALN